MLFFLFHPFNEFGGFLVCPSSWIQNIPYFAGNPPGWFGWQNKSVCVAVHRWIKKKKFQPFKRIKHRIDVCIVNIHSFRLWPLHTNRIQSRYGASMRLCLQLFHKIHTHRMSHTRAYTHFTSDIFQSDSLVRYTQKKNNPYSSRPRISIQTEISK